jgi:hemerythrin superfamily protein
MPNGIDLILADHVRVKELFATFAKTGDGSIVGQIVDALTAHDGAEQAALYPLAAALLDDPELIDRSEAAHSDVKRLIEHLRSEEGAALVDAVNALQAAVTEHVRDEEKNLLPALAKVATVDQLDGLGARIEQNKQRVG